MKKIGIVTFHYAHNYGAMLQAFALQNKLIEYGYSVEIIDYRKPSMEKQYKLIKFIGKNPIKIMIRGLDSIINYKKNKQRFIAFNKFMEKKMRLSNRLYNLQEIKNKYDIYITGSDQVWNKNIVGELSDIYTLNFENNDEKRISYAASVGNAKLISKESEVFKNKLKNLNAISVRELDAKIELDKILNKDINVVLDPTLLLEKKCWENLVENCINENEKYILAYVVEPDDEYIKMVNKLSESKGLPVIHFGLKNPGYKNVLKSAYTEGPLEFVNYIKNAQYVVATSFHATVFSIIFNKKFFIVPHKQTGSRVTNILDKLGIEDRTFNTYDEFENIDYDFETNWSKVEEKLNEERNKSINWLKNSIEGEA